jgi:excisionase family DNA binding protein
MKNYLTISETAKRLRLKVDTVRRLERGGFIRAERTDGGHRRFREEEVERYRKARKAAGKRRPPPAPRQSRSPAEQPGEVMILEEDAPEDFDEFDLIRPQPPPKRSAPVSWFTPIIPARPVPESPSPGAADAARERREEATRLQSIKNHGLGTIPFNIPAIWRGKVVADLEGFVTPTQFPKYLPFPEAANIVRARVEELLAPYHEGLAREKAEKKAQEAARRRVEALRSHGRSYAARQTRLWGWQETQDATKEVGETLTAEVDADWSERDVEDVVDEILDEWAEVEDDEDEDD